jgi:glutathione synthase/RimK-type ligase-like ATP-grasp enzyme
MGFAARWLPYAERCGFHLRQVNGYHSDIIAQLQGCDAFFWQLNQDVLGDLEYARGILLAVQAQGLSVFPDHHTCWHFDDKVAQKYLLEAAGAPMAETWVFYSRAEAMDFLECADYPLIFKLRRGAGSLNVHMVKGRREAAGFARRMFGFGMRPYPILSRIQRGFSRARAVASRKTPLVTRAGRALRFFIRQTLFTPRERGYLLLQRYLADNGHDIRVTIIGNRAFTFLRGVRPNDFRASGSGHIAYPGPDELPMDAIEIAFGISQKLGFQSMAYDFVRDPADFSPKLLEISCSFQPEAVHGCAGYLDASLKWHDGHYWPEHLIIDDVVSASSEGSPCR